MLALAVVLAEVYSKDTTEIVKTLLAFGADPIAIPKEMWEAYMKMPEDIGTAVEPFSTAKVALWYHPGYRDAMQRNLNLTQRYFLAKAAEIDPPAVRTKQIAKAHGMTALLQAPNYLIGQGFAASEVSESIIHHVAFGEEQPIVLVFAGPSKHGKTELALDMKELLSVEHIVVDYTEIRHESDLFGPKAPYTGNEKGSPLNNHLCREPGRRNIVFLDEFEKSTPDLWSAILSITEGESNITTFFREHLQDMPRALQKRAPWKSLDRRIRKNFAGLFGNYITGRISAVGLFMPFSAGEAAVLAHKFILSLKSRLSRPIDVEERCFYGHIDLVLRKDGDVCAHLAREGYDIQFGACPLARVVKETISDQVIRIYDDIPKLIRNEDNNSLMERYIVKLHPDQDGDDIAVFQPSNE